MSVSSMGSEDKDIQLHMYLFTIYFNKECWRLHHSYCFAMENNMKNQFFGILLDKCLQLIIKPIYFLLVNSGRYTPEAFQLILIF